MSAPELISYPSTDQEWAALSKEELSRIGRFRLRRLAENLGALPTDAARRAFMNASADHRTEVIYAALERFRKPSPEDPAMLRELLRALRTEVEVLEKENTRLRGVLLRFGLKEPKKRAKAPRSSRR